MPTPPILIHMQAYHHIYAYSHILYDPQQHKLSFIILGGGQLYFSCVSGQVNDGESLFPATGKKKKATRLCQVDSS